MSMTEIAIISFAQSDCMRDAGARNEVDHLTQNLHSILVLLENICKIITKPLLYL